MGGVHHEALVGRVLQRRVWPVHIVVVELD